MTVANTKQRKQTENSKQTDRLKLLFLFRFRFVSLLYAAHSSILFYFIGEFLFLLLVSFLPFAPFKSSLVVKCFTAILASSNAIKSVRTKEHVRVSYNTYFKILLKINRNAILEWWFGKKYCHIDFVCSATRRIVSSNDAEPATENCSIFHGITRAPSHSMTGFGCVVGSSPVSPSLSSFRHRSRSHHHHHASVSSFPFVFAILFVETKRCHHFDMKFVFHSNKTFFNISISMLRKSPPISIRAPTLQIPLSNARRTRERNRTPTPAISN